MKNILLKAFACMVFAIFMYSCSEKKPTSNTLEYVYKPDDKNLHDTIVYLDSVFFEAYNNCQLNLEKYASFYSDSIEFYHDKGGVMNSKTEIVEATKLNVCGKVTRHLVKGSIEVYPIKGYGAIEMGLHTFKNNQEPAETVASIGRFIIFWQNKNNQWKIVKVVSLH